MSLTTSSVRAFVHSALLSKFAVTGRYLVHPGVLRDKISTQQSTWMEMALGDGCGAAVALGGDVVAWRWVAVENAAAALGGGGSRRTCEDGVGVSVVSLGLIRTTSASALARTAREDASNARDVCRKRWGGDKRIAAAVAVAAVQIQR
jgi:hypothetical protein